MKNLYTSLLFMLFFMLFFSTGFAQKKALRVEDFDGWKHISGAQISQDGKWFCYENNPFKGDGELHIQRLDKDYKQRFARGYKAQLAADGSFFAFRLKPHADSIRQQLLTHVKKDKRSKDSLVVWVPKNNNTMRFGKIKSVKLGYDGGDWLAINTENPTKKKKSKEKKKRKQKDKHAPKTSQLILLQPTTGKKLVFNNVIDYNIAKNGKQILFVQLQNDTITRSTLQVFDTKKAEVKSYFQAHGIIQRAVLSNAGKQLAFLHSADTIKEKNYALYYGKIKQKPRLIVGLGTNGIPEDWVPSKNGSLWFARDESKLYFKTAKKQTAQPKDSLLDSEKARVDLWHWNDLRLQSEQLSKLKSDRDKAYQAVYHIQEGKTVQLSTDFYDYLRMYNFGNANFGLLSNARKQMKARSWDISNGNDYYFVDFKTGERKLLQTKLKGASSLSENGKYFVYFRLDKKTWFTQNTETGESIPHRFSVPMHRDDHDYPSLAPSYKLAGWTKDDKQVWVYDKYDIWAVDPSGKQKPKRLTQGREKQTRYRYRKLNRDINYIDPNYVLLHGFHLKTKQEQLAKLSAKGTETLWTGNYRVGRIAQARKAKRLIWTQESFVDYPNYWTAGLTLDKPKQLSHANPQQSDFLWGQVELFEWEVEKGIKEEGLLYKPENFDPTKKYPVITYFYRLHADELHQHIRPKQSRSVINPTYFTSNGYLVFMPNIRFEVGHPGKSSLKYVSSALKALGQHPFVDTENIGVQGQSWGGYQVAYLVTQTNLFKAAWAGAPVSNMSSAYGAIRWKSGLSRMFQYEKTQSRIGATLWEKPELYIENSPVFHANKINTPLMIMHNDRDGAVPWYQGLELFLALRRLNKPAWLLNYKGQPHNLPSTGANGKDLSIRMAQFFGHYLKGEAAPAWLTDGVPALHRDEFDVIKSH